MGGNYKVMNLFGAVLLFIWHSGIYTPGDACAFSNAFLGISNLSLFAIKQRHARFSSLWCSSSCSSSITVYSVGQVRGQLLKPPRYMFQKRINHLRYHGHKYVPGFTKASSQAHT
ncbi:hypothetical protein F4678DRAFT_84104 [Xylaria arbuscula]|nr:hypothetical protein F4678DRAFT_84104 [Xylaria arbuscula]